MKFKIENENAYADIRCQCDEHLRVYYDYPNICSNCGEKYTLDVKAITIKSIGK